MKNKIDKEVQSPERREALRKLGKMAVYVPPLMMTMLLTEKASAASLFSGGNEGDQGEDNDDQ